MEITGKIVHIDLSGGFWGIQADDGRKFLPVDKLPARMQQQGLKIKARVTPTSSFSVFMWGQSVSIDKIEKL